MPVLLVGHPLYGPHTLDAYIQDFLRLSKDLLSGRANSTIQGPLDLESVQISLRPGVVFDDKPLLRKFGEVLTDATGPYTAGSLVSVRFQGANPRNNLRLEGTFLTVELSDGASWKIIASDSNWETKYHADVCCAVTRTSLRTGYPREGGLDDPSTVTCFAGVWVLSMT